MAEEKKKSSWEIPAPGPGTISGFFVAWVFVGAIIGLTLILMIIGKGPMPLRVVAYDIGVPGEVDQEALLSAVRQTSPMVLVLRGASEDLTKELRLKLEVKEGNFAAKGPSAILSRYSVEKFGGAQFALIRYGKDGRFGVVHLDLNGASELNELRDLETVVQTAQGEFGKAPHAIFALGGSSPPEAPGGYVVASARNQEATNWWLLIPEGIKDNLKECYVPADNEAIKNYSDRPPIVARFVFHKEDFK